MNCFKKANSTLKKQKQVHDQWKIVKNDQSLYEKKVSKLKLKAAKSKIIAFRTHERA